MTDRRLSFAANANGCVTNLQISGDMSGMNWVLAADGRQYAWIDADKAWGSGTLRLGGMPVAWSAPIRRERAADEGVRIVYAPAEGVEVRVERRLERDGTVLFERYEFVNVSDAPCALSEIDIHTPFNDNYPSDSNEMFLRRCHAHVWPGGEGAWVAAMRMDGAAPHLGLAVVEGAVDAYELKERAIEKGLSNVRGVIALSPPDVRLPPGGKTVVTWRVFVQTGWDDFFVRLREMGGVEVQANRYVVRPGETVKVTARTVDGTWTRDWVCPAPGDHSVEIAFGSDRSRLSRVEILGVPDPWPLVLARARFIVEHQQVNDPDSPYDGAFVPYDNETEKQQRRWETDSEDPQLGLDHAEGGERLGMGVLLALVAQRGHRAEFLPALERYHAFVRNRLQEADYTSWGTVARPSRARAYNYPWIIWFHLEMYRLTGESRYLDDMYGTFKRLFSGCVEVPDVLVAFPIQSCVEALESAGRAEDAQVARTLACSYLANVAAFNGTMKTMEVGMAPEMVSGCLGQLLDLYHLTGTERYLAAAKRFIPLADAVCGRQPSWHAHDIGLHHWDGYWFGKRQCWGDTLPHDWNGDMGLAFLRYAEVTGDETFKTRARGIADAMLGLFTPDGRGTCAWIYPNRVNGEAAHFADPLANDQDWALVFYLLCVMPMSGCMIIVR